MHPFDIHRIDDLPEFYDLAVWSYHCEKSPKRKRKQTELFVSVAVPEAMEGEETERKEPLL